MPCPLCEPEVRAVQLALDNALAPYLQNTFSLTLDKAAYLASVFGMMNFIARPVGGICSDYFGRIYGMRGRIWILFTVYALGGAHLSFPPLMHQSLPTATAMLQAM